jgi:hypothetical protein
MISLKGVERHNPSTQEVYKEIHPYKIKRKNTLLQIAAYWKLEECSKLPPIENNNFRNLLLSSAIVNSVSSKQRAFLSFQIVHIRHKGAISTPPSPYYYLFDNPN